MLRSMTGFGRGESARGDRKLSVEIKCVNNRHRDILVRSPRVLQGLEEEIRARVASRMKRGRIEVLVQMERSNGQIEYALDLNLSLARSYHRLIRKLCDELGLDREIKAEDLCQMKDVITYRPEEINAEELHIDLDVAMGEALDACEAMRIQEGDVIEKDLLARLGRIEDHLGVIERDAPLVVEEYRKKLGERLNRLLQGREMDENRLVQEVALFADRSDITEEVVRARSHVGQFRSSLSLDDAVGRKLDFLTQEMHREVNTLSNKALDAAISARAVEIKVELEKIREQVQNVE